jgi:hypothetical protein
MKIKVVVKPKSVLGDYIALHWLVPKNELPVRLRGKIPKCQLWIRDDVWNESRLRRNMILRHEKIELKYMSKGMSYKKAHALAEVADGFF